MQYDKQYRLAVMNDSMVVYQVNFSRDLIEEEFSQRLEGNREVRVLSAVNLRAPCSYDEYCSRWSRRVADECMSAYRRMDSCKKLLNIYATGVTFVSIEYSTRDAAERPLWVSKNVQMLEDEETGDVLGLVCLKDITEQHEKDNLAKEMKRKATMDLLTGLMNHVSGEMVIRERLLSRPDQEYALLVFDVDDFKAINDSRGHQFGDAVLIKTAEVLQSVSRMKDVAVRMGGDEFVLFIELPDRLNEVIERIFRSLCFFYEDFYTSVSMGISTTVDCGRDYSKLFFCADQAMYASKRSGRGQYTIYSQEFLAQRNSHPAERMLGDLLLHDDTFCAVRELLQTFSECMNDYLYIFDMIRDIFYISDSAAERFAIPSARFSHVADTHRQFVYGPDQEKLLYQLDALQKGVTDEHNICYRWLSRSRQPAWINSRGKIVRQSNGTPAFLIGCINEIGARQMADNVSGLLGESSFEQRFEEILCRQENGFILRIGIDEFREINERYGSKYGDFILRSTVISMEKVISPQQELFRMLGDEFVVIDHESSSSKEAKELYRRIRTSIDEMISNMNYEVIFTISGGIVTAKDFRNCTYNEAMKKSQYALGKAKAAGKNQEYVFREEDYKLSLSRSAVLSEMRKSVNNHFVGFSVMYQPMVDASDHRIFSAEALLRYTRENGERLSPAFFVPILEESGLIVPVGKWIADIAARTCQKCREFHPDFRISINLSPVQLQKSAIYPELQKIMEKYELPYDALIIELTESQLLENNPAVRGVWRKMRNGGFLAAVDDFGTGYSNFSNISVMNPQIIKLDKDFTFRAMKNSFDKNLMKSMIDLAHEIGVRVCVEGIETEAEVKEISLLKPDLLQGYYFGIPVHYSKILTILQHKS